MRVFCHLAKALMKDELESLRMKIDELAAENAELRRSNTELEGFAYTASHDLQAPLRVISQTAHLLEMDNRDTLTEEARADLASIISNANRMRMLIENLLNFAKVSSATPLGNKRASTRLALDMALANLQEDINGSGAVITADELPASDLDPAYLVPVFQNLIGNSIKFKGEKIPKIHITANEQQGELLFRLADNGIGIEEKHHARIFDPFRRLHGEAISGTGLGLPLCRKIIERIGGRLWVESEPGKGSDFYFTIPRRLHDAPVTSVPP